MLKVSFRALIRSTRSSSSPADDNAQRLPRLLLVHDQVPVDDVMLGHAQRVSRPLAGKVGQVHRIVKRRASVLVDGRKHGVRNVDSALSRRVAMVAAQRRARSRPV